jgi:HlyD family secretion protein
LKKVLIGAGVLLLLGAIVFASIKAGDKEKGTKVYAEDAARREISQIVKATGELDPRVKVKISAHVVAKIEKIFVEEGGHIEKGKPFIRLEQQVFVAQRDQWTAQLRSSETAVQQAQVSLADSRVKLARAQKLGGEGIATREQIEAAQLAEASARLQLDSSRQAVHQAQANLTKAEDDLTKTTIYSPLSGKVIALNAEEGEVVIPGTMNNPASEIATIADMSEILAYVNVDETEIVNVKVGQAATIKVDAIPDREYQGKVVEVGSSGFTRPQQPDIKFFKVKVLLDRADEDLRAGMSVRAEIHTASHPQALVIPIQAVIERRADEEKQTGKPAAAPATAAAGGDDEVKVVFVIEAGKAKRKRVETGISDDTHVELLSGLKAGEKVVTGPYRTLRDLKEGAQVRISKTSEAEDRKKDKDAAAGDKGD